jgi:DMSO/TMAO reductase YedYZ molybdopterin-dependent catalytic subunit
MRWVWVITAALALPVSLPGLAAADPGTVSVAGDVRHPLALTLDALRAYPPQTQSVAFGTDTGPQAHVYEGAALADVVTAAEPAVEPGRKHPLLPFTILAIGVDGYSAAVSWGEMSPDLAAKPVLVAYTEDGRPLDQPRLVVPGDVEGARYVSDLVELRVVDLA